MGDVNDLIAKRNNSQVTIDFEILQQVVAMNTKKRFAFDDTKARIRANQGHSIAIDLGLEATIPPEILYHGTAERFLPLIKTDGLLKMQRQHVHLSADKQTAGAVGQRHGKPVVFTVAPRQMYRDGFSFFLADNGVRLTEHVPSRYL